MRIRFWNLVVRVDSINRLFGQVKLFVRKHKLQTTTNGKLLIVTEMISPPGYLLGVIMDILTPLGMFYGEDYALVMEASVRDNDESYSSFIEQELPITTGLDWLSSSLDFNGCYVWCCQD
jgi:hypothetical protein